MISFVFLGTRSSLFSLVSRNGTTELIVEASSSVGKIFETCLCFCAKFFFLDILSDSVKEKVTRIVVAVFRNLIEKPEEPQICKEHCIAMVQSKVLKHLDILQQRKFEDEDIQGDITFLSDKLMASIVDLSSFDEYGTEIKSGRLEWSPVHKSERFW